MANELERLLLSFEADTSKLKKALSDAEAGVVRFESNTGKWLGGAERHFKQFESQAMSSLKKVGALLVAQAGLSKLYGDISDVANIQKTAAAVGISAQKLQELRIAAGGAGAAVGDIDGALKSFATNMGEFRNRSGDLYKFLEESLPTVAAQLRATKNQSEALDVVADATARLSNAEERALFIKKMMGESATEFTPLLAKNSKGLSDAAAEAHRFGQVISDDAVKSLADLKKELDGVSNTLTANFQESLARAAPGVTKFLSGIREYVALFNSAQKMTFAADKVVSAANVTKPATELGANFGRIAGGAAADGFKTAMAGLKMKPIIGDWTTEFHEVAGQLNAITAKAQDVLGNYTDAARDEYDKELRLLQDLLTRKLITEQEYQTSREQLSIAAGARIAAAYDKETEHLRERLNDVKSVVDNALGKGIEDILRTGKTSFAEMVQSMTVNLAKLAIQAQITKPLLDALFKPGGSGSFMGMDSNVLDIAKGMIGAAAGGLGGEASGGDGKGGAPGRAAGGPVSAGKPYVVGEKRPELFVPNTSGRIIPHVPQGGGTINIDARGADIGVEQRLRAMFSEMQRGQSSPVEAMARVQKRFPTRKAA